MYPKHQNNLGTKDHIKRILQHYCQNKIVNKGKLIMMLTNQYDCLLLRYNSNIGRTRVHYKYYNYDDTLGKFELRCHNNLL